MNELLLTLLLMLNPQPEVELYKGIPKTRKKKVQCVQNGGTWDEKANECKGA